MSGENVEVVRGLARAFSDDGLDAVAEFWAPDIDWRAIPGALDDVGEMHGRDAVRAYVQDWLDTFDDMTNDPAEITELGADRVVVEHHLSGRAKLSGAQTELRYAVVYTIRHGKIVRGREYATFDEALEAAREK